MASIPNVLLRLRKAKRQTANEEPRFGRYEAEYRQIFEVVNDTGGDDAVSALESWTVESTTNNGKLPSPEDLREEATHCLEEGGYDIPAELHAD